MDNLYPKIIAIIGAGPSGLMAAEILAAAGHQVTIYDRMPSPGRKFLMAGRGGLNLTHSEPMEGFLKKYDNATEWMSPYIKAFPPQALRAWCEGLGQETFIGSSGRIFPRSMKAAPLLRAWLKRLDGLGVKYVAQHTWHGWEGDELIFSDAAGKNHTVKADATLLALGGASWPRLGSDGGWMKIFAQAGIAIAPLRPSNCGFLVKWSEYFRTRFAGMPLKPVAITHEGVCHQGEMTITAHGIEGGAVYAFSSILRESIDAQGVACVYLDLRPGMSCEALANKLQTPRGNQSFSTYLRKAGFTPLAIALLREANLPGILAKATPLELAALFKSIPITLTGNTGMARAISSAGGIKREALNEHLMLVAKPSVFAAGEMLDWEAPTGGYLLQGCLSTAVAAAHGILEFLGNKKPAST